MGYATFIGIAGPVGLALIPICYGDDEKYIKCIVIFGLYSIYLNVYIYYVSLMNQ